MHFIHKIITLQAGIDKHPKNHLVHHLGLHLLALRQLYLRDLVLELVDMELVPEVEEVLAVLELFLEVEEVLVVLELEDLLELVDLEDQFLEALE